MRVNQYLARATGLSRRAADQVIAEGQVQINETLAVLGSRVGEGDTVRFKGRPLTPPRDQLIMLHKPVGYITSRRKQGSTPTIYRLLPDHLHRLKPVGRLDRDTSGLLLLTSDGNLAQALQHPSAGKWKHYTVQLNRPLTTADQKRLDTGVELEDGVSRLQIVSVKGPEVSVKLQEGRNRQIRRTFAALGYAVKLLHRDRFGEYALGELKPGQWRELPTEAA